jgi:hypothetical protein
MVMPRELRNSVDQQQHAAAALRCFKFAAQEQLRGSRAQSIPSLGGEKSQN